MKSIILSLTVVLASIAYVQAGTCTLTWFGQYRHETGNQSGCYGVDESDPITKVTVSTVGSSYIFYSDYGCTGDAIITGHDTSSGPPVKAKSVYLTCA
ncbi:3570_t:CDS:2 [Ambispora leptoticha]|uniref:3570_t:CDS:1 n=1 Tax=Ambispora leptoticha TaxID=144679 RepID=A0A9N9ATG2_9GLOM|nr:3570_t:CDS:2 [Ambispora leptoticha]